MVEENNDDGTEQLLITAVKKLSDIQDILLRKIERNEKLLGKCAVILRRHDVLVQIFSKDYADRVEVGERERDCIYA